MVRSSFTILFFIRDSRARKDGTASIEVVLTVNGERCAFSTSKRVEVLSSQQNYYIMLTLRKKITQRNVFLFFSIGFYNFFYNLHTVYSKDDWISFCDLFD